MTFLSAGSTYVAADSLKMRWRRKILSLNAGGDREASFEESNVNYQFLQVDKTQYVTEFNAVLLRGEYEVKTGIICTQ